MEVISVEPRDVHVFFSMSIKQIDYLLCFLDEIDGPITKKRTKDSVDYVKNTLFPLLDKLHEDITNGS